MNGYFKPLRRKIGVVTLVAACLMMFAWFMMCAWLKSLNDYHEYIVQRADEPSEVLKFKTHRFVIASTSRKFVMCHVRNDSRIDMIGPFYEADPEHPFNPIGMVNSGVMFAMEIPIERQLKYCGFELTKRAKITRSDQLPIEITSVAIPYMAVTLPLSLLSAWLLLSKPRAKPHEATASAQRE